MTEATATIGRAGGTLELGDLRLKVPADSLTEDVKITVRISGDYLENSVSELYLFEPEHLHFNFGAELSVPIGGYASDVVLVNGAQPTSEQVPAEVRTTDGKAFAVARIPHFSGWFAKKAEKPTGGQSYCAGFFDGRPNEVCKLQGRDEYVAWAITELGETGMQTDTWIAFKNVSEKLVLVSHFEVTDGKNVTKDLEPHGVRYEDHEKPRPFDTGGIRVLRPANAPSEEFTNAVDAAEESQKDWWRFGELNRWVTPEDETERMSYKFCLGYRIAGSETVYKVCGAYAGILPSNEPEKVPCGDTCGSGGELCETGLSCRDLFDGSECSSASCSGLCVPTTCSGAAGECLDLCDIGPYCPPDRRCASDGACGPGGNCVGGCCKEQVVTCGAGACGANGTCSNNNVCVEGCCVAPGGSSTWPDVADADRVQWQEGGGNVWVTQVGVPGELRGCFLAKGGASEHRYFLGEGGSGFYQYTTDGDNYLDCYGYNDGPTMTKCSEKPLQWGYVVEGGKALSTRTPYGPYYLTKYQVNAYSLIVKRDDGTQRRTSVFKLDAGAPWSAVVTEGTRQPDGTTFMVDSIPATWTPSATTKEACFTYPKSL